MTLRVLPEPKGPTASATIEALTARLAAAHAGAGLGDAGAGYPAGDAAAASSCLPAGL